MEDSEKFYIERINIFGNYATSENVIRNSLIVDEGDAYNEILVNKSINQIKSRRIFKTVKKIEKIVGRKKALKNYPRICDIDIIDFKGLSLETQLNGQQIETPHPRMQSRNFVIFPLYELNKTWIHPKTKANINNIINKFKNVDFCDIRIVKI